MAELVKRDDQEEAKVLKDIPGDRRINPVAAVNLVYGNQEPGPVQEDIDPRKAKQADGPLAGRHGRSVSHWGFWSDAARTSL